MPIKQKINPLFLFRQRRISLWLNYFIAFLLLFSPVLNAKAQNEPWAVREWSLFIDESTILKGYTVVAGDNEFKLGVRDKAISQSATAMIRELNETHVPDGPVVNAQGEELNYKRVSSAWEFDFLASPRIGVLNKPLYVAIKNPVIPPKADQPPLGLSSGQRLAEKDEQGNTDMRRKTMCFWDGVSKKWKMLPGINDLENNLTRAIIHLPYAILAVFELPDEFEAWASWYGDGLTPSSPYNCASNNHEIGSYVKVCRLDNLEKCVKVKVVSRGPFIDNRIVDMTKTAFRAIGNPGGGVLGVRVISVE